MKWYWRISGIHTLVRVFVNGANCGLLCFRNEEFAIIMNRVTREDMKWAPEDKLITFVEEEKT